jgi:hypothetical protein
MQVCTVVSGNVASTASGKPLQPVDAADQDVLHAALLEVGEDLRPELRALVGLKPHAEHLTLAVHIDRQPSAAIREPQPPAVSMRPAHTSASRR